MLTARPVPMPAWLKFAVVADTVPMLSPATFVSAETYTVAAVVPSYARLLAAHVRLIERWEIEPVMVGCVIE